jgi:endonuclease YncB( thermonuclease family)
MFGRRNKSDGFEWHRYVPTVIRQRREARHERMLEARRAAAQQMSAAGSALAAGSVAAGAAARDGARAGLGAAGLALQTLWGVLIDLCVLLGRAIVAGILFLGRAIATAAEPIIQALAQPMIGAAVALAAAVAVGFSVGRYRVVGLDREATIALGLTLILLIALLPLVSTITGLRFPRISVRTAPAGLAVAALAAGGAALYAGGSKVNLTGITGSITSQLPIIGDKKPVQGRADALGGDVMRVGATTVRLAGIEAPERQQTCGTGNRRYRCGAAAESALGRLVNGRTVSCTLSGADPGGRPLAYCKHGTTDINGEMVRQGHVFAGGSLFATYSSLEREARAAKAGIWAAGDPERPADYRARLNKGPDRRADRGS